MTTSAPLAAELCPGSRTAEHERLRAVRYVGVVCASFLVSRTALPYFMTYVADPAAPFARSWR